MTDTITRFSDRVTDYVRYRPHYPEAMFDALSRHCGLGRDSVIADVGAGTGISTLPWCQREFAVQAIEPNREMRAALRATLSGHPRAAVIDGTAETTTLASHSVDLICVAQAFHWFDLERTRREFERVLATGGQVALVWNERDTQRSEFLSDYDRVLRTLCPEYPGIRDDRRSAQRIAAFFAPESPTVFHFENSQHVDRAGLLGRVWSASYAPAAGQPGHEELRDALDELFERYQQHGRLRFDYVTEVNCAPLPPKSN